MKRTIYYVKSYDGTIEKTYHNYKSAINYCNRLINKDIDCGIYTWNDETNNLECIMGC